MAAIDNRSIERTAYRSRWDDGLFDVFVGLSLLWIGAAWLWFDAMAVSYTHLTLPTNTVTW